MRKRTLQALGIVIFIAAALTGSFLLAGYIQDSGAAQELVERFGYLGMLALSIFAGLNLFVPIPAATFTPIYTAAGFPLYGIIITLVIGTTIADSIGYLIGFAGKHAAKLQYPVLQQQIQKIVTEHHIYMIPFVFLWSSFAPLPNETIIIPLALIGIKFRALIIPLILGTIIHQTYLAYGISSIFEYLF